MSESVSRAAKCWDTVMRSVEGTLASSRVRFRRLELPPTPRSSAASADRRSRLPTLPLPSTASTASPQCESNTVDEPIDKVGEWSSRSPLIYNTQHYVMVHKFHSILSRHLVHCHQSLPPRVEGSGDETTSAHVHSSVDFPLNPNPDLYCIFVVCRNALAMYTRG